MLSHKICLTTALRASVGVAALLVSCVAHAQAPAADEPAAGELVVTGSRVKRDGYNSPTPVSVVSRDEISRSATPNIADYVNTLPSLSGSSTPATTSNMVGQGRQGINAMNVRGIGTVRTLTLLDGRRVGGMANDVTVDVSERPQQLASRVDVVTGGASASYGSDALSGVVNFVLDTKFTGLRGEIFGGQTTYGDNQNWKVALTYGAAFAGGRGHFLLSGEASHEDGIYRPGNRDWTEANWGYINNPAYTATNGQPRVLRKQDIALSTATFGGAIACTATSTCASLRGIAFGPGGTPYNLVLGPIVSDPIMSGGTQADNSPRNNQDNSMVPRQNRRNLFARVSYDVADDWNIYAEGMVAHLDTDARYFSGTFGNTLAVRVDNPYMPAEIAARMRALNLTSVPFGTLKGDNPVSGANSERGYTRVVAGGDGKFDALDTEWTIGAYYQFARTALRNTATNATRLPNWNRAIDAVRAPNGSIICRSTLTNPTDGCIPYNLFGTGVNNQAAIDYVTGNPTQDSVFKQNVVSINIAGEPFEIWAGPVSLAFGVEHRTQSADGVADPITQVSVANWDTTGGLPTIGSYKVSDAYVETVIPLARDQAWAKQLTINAASRVVKYESGTFVTWKLGAEYMPIESLRIRGIASRDVREANLSDRFAGVFQTSGSFLDPNNNGAATTARGLTTGNPNLDPEIGRTYSAGIVFQPTFLSGFNASVDYYKVSITGAIGSLNIQQVVNLCFAGNQDACALITATPAGPQQFEVRTAPLNLASESTRGLDFEASYRFRFEDLTPGTSGTFTIRGLATNYISYTVNPGLPGSIVTERAGAAGLPSWRYQLSVNYQNERLALSGTMRGVSGGVQNNNWIECQSGCPTSTGDNPTYDDISIAAATYFDLSATYSLGDNNQFQFFFNVRNIFNKDPAVVPAGPTGHPSWWNQPIERSQYDILGRVFGAGIRFRI
ncbi:TonB-dependent receptor [Polymorphobacter multimanifer]|uniref:TonB-dependent receptor domain-containing protein n=1 Tax=Polymorphobacter multimanifer TaxID=1070431 RepID=UPI00166A9957|nr:TonB-dependent receptor [Polymorphobacter multimanifer]GGI73052.1 TonB-dependent receptor [Polymorphobacter multimanifer]